MNIKKAVSTILVVLMVFSLIPANIFAAGKFTDTNGHWAEAAIDRWSDYGVLLGYPEGNFLPGNGITRAEMAVIINRVMSYTERSDSNTFSDVSVANDWFADGILKLHAAGIILGTNGKANPTEKITRQEAITMIARAFDIYDENVRNPFSDESSIDSWALPYVRGMKTNGYINGYEDGSFMPKNILTRAEVVTILDNIIEEFYNNSATLGMSSRTTNVYGNIVISSRDVSLINYNVNGDVYITQGVDRGDVDITGTTISGTLFVWGGGSNSVTVTNSEITNVSLNNANTRLFSSNSKLKNVNVINGILDISDSSDISRLIMSNGSTNVLKNSNVDNVTSTGGSLTVDGNSVIDSVTAANTKIDVKSTGTINNLTINRGSSTTLNVDGNVKKLNSAENINVTGTGKIDENNMELSSSVNDDKTVTLKTAVPDGSNIALTTKLILTFDKNIANIGVNDITITANNTGATKGTLTKVDNTTGVYELTLNTITASGTITVAFAKTDYTVLEGSTKTVGIFYAETTNAIVNKIEVNGDANFRTSKMTVTFNMDISNLSAADFKIVENNTAEPTNVSINSFSKVAGSTGVYELGLTGITKSGTVKLLIKKSGYTFSTASNTAKLSEYVADSLNIYYNTSLLTDVSFNLSADGDSTNITTKLTLTFNHNVEPSNIAISYGTLTTDGAASKGTLKKISDGVYELTVTPTKTGTINVSVTAPSGYTFSPTTRSVTVYKPEIIAVAFNNAVINDATTTTTRTIRLTFDKDMGELSISNITIDQVGTSTGAIKDGITRVSSGVYDLTISNVTASGTIRVTVSNKTGYTITPATQQVAIYYNAGVTNVTFTGITQSAQAGVTTKLYLNLSQDLSNLTTSQIFDAISINDSNNTGARKSSLIKTSGTTGQYELTIAGVTSSGVITVTFGSLTGYIVSPSQSVSISGMNNVELLTVSSNGGSKTDTLTLTFNSEVVGLTAADILLSGEATVTKGSLTPSNSGKVYTLNITVPTSSDSKQVVVNISSPTGYNITGAPKYVRVYNNTGTTTEPPPSTGTTYALWEALETDGVSKGSKIVMPTTKFIIYFNQYIDGLNANHFTITEKDQTGITISGSLIKTDIIGKYELNVTGIIQTGNVVLTVAKDGVQFDRASRDVKAMYLPDSTVKSIIVKANGSAELETTQLELYFDDPISGLSASNIVISGAASDGIKKGILVPKNKVNGGRNHGDYIYDGQYILPISGVKKSGQIIINITSPSSKYTIAVNPVYVDVFFPETAVVLNNVAANGSHGTTTTTQLTLTFNKNVNTLTTADLNKLLNSISIDNSAGSAEIAVTATLSKGSANNQIILPVVVTRAGEISVAIENVPPITGHSFINTDPDHITGRVEVWCTAKMTGVTAEESPTTLTGNLVLKFDRELLGLTSADLQRIYNAITITNGTGSATKRSNTVSINPNNKTELFLPIDNVKAGTITVSMAKIEVPGYSMQASGNISATVYNPVSFTGVVANGSATETTTELTLTFSKEFTGLTLADITIVSGNGTVTKGNSLTPIAGHQYKLSVTVTKGGTFTVNVAGVLRSGYNIQANSISTNAICTANLISIESVANSSGLTTKLLIKFDKDIDGLRAEHITLSWKDGFTVGALTKVSGRTGEYELAINNVTKGGTISVNIDDASLAASYKIPVKMVNNIAINCVATLSSVTVVSATPTTELLLTFDRDITLIDATALLKSITITNGSGIVSKTGTLNKVAGSNSYKLGIDVAQGGSVTVTIAGVTTENVIFASSSKTINITKT